MCEDPACPCHSALMYSIFRIQELQTEGFTFETVADLGRIGMSEKQVATFVKKNAVSCL